MVDEIEFDRIILKAMKFDRLERRKREKAIRLSKHGYQKWSDKTVKHKPKDTLKKLDPANPAPILGEDILANKEAKQKSISPPKVLELPEEMKGLNWNCVRDALYTGM